MNSKTGFLLKLLSWVILVLSVVCSYSVFTLGTHEGLISADAVSVQFIYDDFIAGSGKLKDWYFPASPSLFPDLTLYTILQLFHFKYTVSILLYAIFQMIIISLLTIFIFKKIASPAVKPYSWLIPSLYSIFFIEVFYFSHDILMSQFLSSCFYHAGPFVNCLIVISVFLSSWKNAYKCIFFFLFSVIAAFSDMLYLVLLTAPLSLSLLLTVNKSSIKFVLFSVLCLAVGAYAGIKINKYLNDSGITHFFSPHKMFDFNGILPALKIYLGQMQKYLLIPGFRSFIILFVLISLPITLFLLVFKKKHFSKEMIFMMVFYFLFSSMVLSAPIINGNYTGFDTLRYNVAVFYFSIIILVFFIAYLLEFKIKSEKLKPIISMAFLLVFLIMILIKISPSGLKNYVNYYPSLAKEVDDLSDRYQLKHGISWLTHAKYITAFSKKNLEVLPVHADGCIWEIGSNINWYYDNDFDFIITHGIYMDFSKSFKIIDTLQTSDFTILRVQKFHYPPGTYIPLTK